MGKMVTKVIMCVGGFFEHFMSSVSNPLIMFNI